MLWHLLTLLATTTANAPDVVDAFPRGDIAQDMIKVAMAIVLGGIIGAEREYRDKAAGFRTVILICVGSCIFTMLSPRIGWADGHQARIAAAIVTGIGFLGAGAIIQRGDHIMGLTTATSVWVAAALGMTVGAGDFQLAVWSTVAVLIVLAVFPIVERWIGGAYETRVYRIEVDDGETKTEAMTGHFEAAGLVVQSATIGQKHELLTFTVKASGRAVRHDKVAEALVADPKVVVVES